MKKSTENILILHNIRSVQNVGAMFRTADAAGINKIYLTGYTPTPLDRFGRKRRDVAKSALGAEEFVPWEQRSLPALLRSLRRAKYFIIAIEQDKKSTDYKTLRLHRGQGNVFIVGAEVTGIPKNVLEKCDIIAEIPMKGKKESLNVSVALGIALFRVLNL
jgi:tRNA G18 (ribose-2'-O)-methylase SpoU